MPKDIKKLLNKNSWTGKEVGKALLMSLQRDIERKDNPKLQPLFSQDDLNRMMDGLDTDEKYMQFKIFSVIYSAIVDSFNLNQAQIQQFYNGYYRYLYSIRETERAENYYNSIKQFPLILTQSQYDQILKEALETKREMKLSFYGIFFHVLQHFLWQYNSDSEQGKIPAEIKEAFDAAQKQSPNNKRHLEQYNKIWAKGYYQLEDGTRLDVMTKEKWEELFKNKYTDSHEFIIDTEPDSQAELSIQLTEKGKLYAIKLLYGGAYAIKKTYREKTGEDLQDKDIDVIEQVLENLIDGISNFKLSDTKKALALFYEPPADKKWHYYEEITKEPTNYDLIKQVLEDYENNKIPKQEVMKEFMRSYPLIYTAIKSYIKKNIPSAKKLKAAQYYENIIPLNELNKTDSINYKWFTTVSDIEITPGIYNGIAVIKCNPITDIDRGIRYTDPIDNASLMLHNIDYLENNPDETEEIEQTLNVLALPALRYMYAYNDFIEIITSVYDIKFIAEAAKYDLSRQEKQIDELNNMIYTLYSNVQDTIKRTKRQKRKFIQETFKPIKLEDLKPTQEAKQVLREELETLGYSRKAAVTIKHFRQLIESIARR